MRSVVWAGSTVIYVVSQEKEHTHTLSVRGKVLISTALLMAIF